MSKTSRNRKLSRNLGQVIKQKSKNPWRLSGLVRSGRIQHGNKLASRKYVSMGNGYI
jgi:hypothetical protein